MKQLPVGVQDFISIRKSDKYYVDKSMLIGQILSYNSNGAYLITRPRRFGKSVNLSMLDAFFNLEYEGNKWFDGLEISEHPEYDSYKNAFPAISVDLKSCYPYSFDGFIREFNSMLEDIFEKFTYLRKSPEMDEENRELFDKYHSEWKSDVDSEYALYMLCSMLEKHHNSKVVVLIDGYDYAINSTDDDYLRIEIASFLRNVLTRLLKDNSSLQLGVITGINQIAMADDFGGLDNIVRDNVLNTHFGEMYGFTEDEVKQICADYGHPEKSEEAKKWYGGYRFNDAEVYNPWNILNYIQKNFETGPYWMKTDDYRDMQHLISEAYSESAENFQTLVSGGAVTETVDATMTSDGYRDVYSQLTAAGCLRAVPGKQYCELSVPNRELFNVFSEIYKKSTD